MALLIAAGCGGVDDEQMAFERKAYRDAEGFTRTDASGRIVEEDGDDWRISPVFGGLMRVEPAFPNPVCATCPLYIHVTADVIDPMNGLYIAVHSPGEYTRIVWSAQAGMLEPGLYVARLSPLELGRYGSVESARGLHRLILFDSREQVLSYGDVLVE